MFSLKLLNRESLATAVGELREAGKRIVFTNGCFDILHFGHIHLLTKASELGDVLMVGLNTDASVKRIKGSSRPVNGENERAALLASLEMVDCVVLFEEDTPEELINQITPDFLVKGGDWQPEDVVGAGHVTSNGGQVVIIPFVEGYSTTGIIARSKRT